MNRILRFKDIFNNFDNYHFHILGCGAIGSSAATQIARSGGEKFTLYDYDKVSIENIGVSQYILSDINKHKVDVLTEHLYQICQDPIIIGVKDKFMDDIQYTPHGNDIIVLGFDNMSSRLQAVEIACSVKKLKPVILIDGRMGAQTYQQYAFIKPTVTKYKKCWYDDDNASEEPCTAKATSFCSNMAGSFITNAISKIVNKQPYEKEILFHFPSMVLTVK
jgi:molybdopterin/thiamine biosynthesis adenylyltransferase